MTRRPSGPAVSLTTRPSRLAGTVIGALFMVGPGCIGLATNVYWAIGRLCRGGVAHQTISCMINTLSTDLLSGYEVATASGLAGTAAWTGGPSFSPVVGALAQRIGFSPLFVCLSILAIAAAMIAILLLRDRGAADEITPSPPADR